MDCFRLDNQVALVTGGTRGIGLAIAKLFQQAGATVLIHGTNQTATEAIAKEHGMVPCWGDFTDSSTVKEMAERVSALTPTLDILVNNAGFEKFSSMEETSEGDLDSIYNVNAKAPYFLTQALLPLLKESPKPSIINVTSIHEMVPVRENGAYCIAKAALAMQTKIASLEFGKYGIRVNNLAPGAIETDMNREIVNSMPFEDWIPLGRVGTVDEIASAALFLASTMSSYVTGTTIFVDGGYKENLLRY